MFKNILIIIGCLAYVMTQVERFDGGGGLTSRSKLRDKLAGSLMAFGGILIVVGFIIVVFSPQNLTIFGFMVEDPRSTVGVVVALAGFLLSLTSGFAHGRSEA